MEPRTGNSLRCRKDTQCKCVKCEESIDATRDLRSPSKLMFQPEIRDSPAQEQVCALRDDGRGNEGWKTRSNRGFATPALEGEVRSSTTGDRVWRRFGWRLLIRAGKLWTALIPIVALALTLDFAVPGVTTGVSNPILGSDYVMSVAHKCRHGTTAMSRLLCIQRDLSRVLTANDEAAAANCTRDEDWKLHENDKLVHSTCELYSSMAETVRLWGYPLQTSGIVGRSLVDRSFYVLSGQLWQWHEGRLDPLVRAQGEEWILPKWTAATVQLDRDTWILEYHLGLQSNRKSLYFTDMRIRVNRIRAMVARLSRSITL